jgi:peptidoglycan/xylan/chitin deacetylase (PgdA/CDA1 family)
MYRIFLAFLAIAVWLAFVPPRFILSWITRRTDGRVVFFFNPVVNDGKPVIYLTIDDSPTEYTKEILDVLDKVGGRALFFVIGKYARANKEVLQDIISRGHLVGNHDDENRLTANPFRSPEAIIQGLSMCENTLTDKQKESSLTPAGTHLMGLTPAGIHLMGLTPAGTHKMGLTRWMRPGCGWVSPVLLDVAKKMNLWILLGDVYGHDCQFQWAPKFLRWFYLSRVRSGSVVILHDGSKRRAENTASIILALGQKFNILPPPTSLAS